MHELEEFVNDSLEELPMSSEEARILANNIHDVGSNDRLVVLPSFHFTQSQQVFDYRD